MKIKTLILGFGITGKSCAKYFNRINQVCRIYDTRPSSDLTDISEYSENEFFFQ